MSIVTKLKSRLYRRALGAPIGTAWKSFFWKKCKKHKVDFIVESNYKFKISGNTKDVIQKYIYYFGVWEPTITEWMLRELNEGDAFIDVGANIGYYSLLASAKIGNTGRVLAIEAHPEIFGSLQNNISINHAKNICAINKAVTEKNTSVAIGAIDSSNVGATALVDTKDGSIDYTISGVPLSDLMLEQLGLVEQTKIIKIDVEGSELGVVLGMEALLDQLPQTTKIIIEVAPERIRERGGDVDRLFNIFYNHGYRSYTINNDYSPAFYLTTQKTLITEVFIAPAIQTDIIFSKQPPAAL